MMIITQKCSTVTILRSFLSLMVILVISQTDSRAEYSYIEIMPPGCISTVARDINDAGDVAGTCNSTRKGFIFSDGIYKEIVPPGFVRSEAYGINNNNALAGRCYDSMGKTAGFLYNGSSYVELMPPDWNNFRAEKINDGAEIIAYLGVLFHVPEGIIELPGKGNVEGVHRLGAIQGNEADVISFVHHDVGILIT